MFAFRDSVIHKQRVRVILEIHFSLYIRVNFLLTNTMIIKKFALLTSFCIITTINITKAIYLKINVELDYKRAIFCLTRWRERN